jgi:uncharacterized protein (TIGR02598 family)
VGREGFTLVEVAIAMGIFVFATTAILGVLPVAMQSGRNAFDMAVATQSADALAAQLEFSQTPISVGATPTTNWFDNSGNEVAQNLAIYEASTLLKDSVSPNLRRVAITVKRGMNERTFCYLLFNNQL